jgi:integrase
MATELDRVAPRMRLAPRREPYWQRLSTGQFLGFRPSLVGDSGFWIVKAFDHQSNRRVLHALGDYSHLPSSDRYKAALRDARRWLDHLAGGGSVKQITVRQACETYATSRPDAQKRFERFVYQDLISGVFLQKLTEKQVRSWRQRLQDMPALVTRNKGKATVTKLRSPATLNRDMVPFRAALNQALRDGYVLTAKAWRNALIEADAPAARREIYLTREQRRQLIESLPADLATFVAGLSRLPIRPGALSALRVKDFDSSQGFLTIQKDKDGVGRKIKLPDGTASMLRDLAVGKPNDERLFLRSNGTAWNKDAWKKQIKAVALRCGLPANTTAYSLRHSTITDLVVDRLDLLTIAQISGTSVSMIEKHYGHLQNDIASNALARLIL